MSKLVTCKVCGAQVAKSAKVCPQCGAKRNPSVLRVIIAIILLFIGFFALMSAFSGSSEEVLPEKITIDEFNAIETGMTYNEVVKIVGSDGELTSQVDIGEYEFKTEIYVWYGIVPGANANVTFQGGKVVAKAQFGLA